MKDIHKKFPGVYALKGVSLQLRSGVWGEELLAPESAVVQLSLERREACAAPVRDWIGMQKGVRAGVALSKQELRRLAPDGVRRVADERDVRGAHLQRRRVDVHHDGRNSGYSERGHGVLGVRDRYDEAVRSVPDRMAYRIACQFAARPDQLHIPRRRFAVSLFHVAEDSGQLSLSGDARHLQRDENLLLAHAG